MVIFSDEWAVQSSTLLPLPLSEGEPGSLSEGEPGSLGPQEPKRFGRFFFIETHHGTLMASGSFGSTLGRFFPREKPMIKQIDTFEIHLVGGFNPFEKYVPQIGSFPQVRL